MGKIQLATPPATTPAKSVVMAVLGASNRSIDSITNNEEANGAAKAAANPAPAPADNNCFRSPLSTLPHFDTKYPTYEPICTEGPSRPKDNPVLHASIPPTNFATNSRKGCL